MAKRQSCLTFVFLILFFVYQFPGKAQNLKAFRIEDPIQIDGVLNEASWFSADSLTQLIQFVPHHDEPSPYRTVVRILYDRKYLYVSFFCFDPEPDRITARITKRDGGIDAEDAVGIALDSFDDDNNAYFFAVNPLGTQVDMRIADNGRTTDSAWDMAWESAAGIHELGWTAEIAIPFEGLKYNRSSSLWGFNAGRTVGRDLEMSWTSGGLIAPYRVSQFGSLEDLDMRSLDVRRFSVIPYGQLQIERGETPQWQAGLDLRANITANLGIDATVNPDFATVEGDVEQVNLTRFELSYPEKRPFFMEGAENYSTRIRQFYSRRIGEIPWGMKIIGKLGRWTINGLATQSDPSTAGMEVDPGQKALYSVFRINRDMARGSTVGLIGANRTYEGRHNGSVGLVASLFFSDVLGMTSQVIQTYGEEDQGTWTYFIRPAYDSEFTHFHVRYSHYGTGVMENMNSIGFVPDDDRREFDTNFSRTFWVNRYGLESIAPEINYNQYWSQEGKLRSWENDAEISVTFLKKWKYGFNWCEEFKRYEKDYRNRVIENEIGFDSKTGFLFSLNYSSGIHYDSDFESMGGGVDVKILSGWNVEYRFDKYWFRPKDEEDSWIHYLRTSFYFNPDLFVKVFYQTKHSLRGEWQCPETDLLRKTLQVIFVWRFLPPFGSLQIAYQEGTARITETEEIKTLFTKLSWVF